MGEAVQERRYLGLGKQRIEALTDGVFSIAMTLLVFGIKIPDLSGPNISARLPHELASLKPELFAYGLSFIMLGIYWVGHHNQFHYIRRSDRVLLWLNLAFLMCLTFIPFSTAILGRYPGERLSIIVYAGNLIVVGLLLYAIWWYATGGLRLVDHDIEPRLVAKAKTRILVAPCVFCLSIPLSFWSVRLSLILFLLVPILYILPGRIDVHWSGRSEKK